MIVQRELNHPYKKPNVIKKAQYLKSGSTHFI